VVFKLLLERVEHIGDIARMTTVLQTGVLFLV